MFESTNGVMPRELVPQQRMGNEDELAGTLLYMVSRVGLHLYPCASRMFTDWCRLEGTSMEQ